MLTRGWDLGGLYKCPEGLFRCFLTAGGAKQSWYCHQGVERKGRGGCQDTGRPSVTDCPRGGEEPQEGLGCDASAAPAKGNARSQTSGSLPAFGEASSCSCHGHGNGYSLSSSVPVRPVQTCSWMREVTELDELLVTGLRRWPCALPEFCHGTCIFRLLFFLGPP